MIHCSQIATDTYISERDNDLWHLYNSSFSNVRKYNVSLGDDRIGLIRVASFGVHLQHYEMELPPRMSLLNLLAKSQEVIEQLQAS